MAVTRPSAGTVLRLASQAVDLEPKQMADAMAISSSLVSRGLKDADHLSFHRLWGLSDEFWIELVYLIARARGIWIRREVILDLEKAG